MKKFPTENFYIGTINIALPNNALMAACGAAPTKEENQLLKFMIRSTDNGALQLGEAYRKTNPNTGISHRYETLLTFFYKEDDKYYCMHNGYTYGTEIDDAYCDNLVKLSDAVPKFGFVLPKEISKHYVYDLVKKLFMKNRNPGLLYNNDKFDADRFYTGELEMCTGYREYGVHSEYNRLNILESITLNHQRHLYTQSGSSSVFRINGVEYEADYSDFSSIFYRIDDENFYNINNYKIYNINSLKPLTDRVTICTPLRVLDHYSDLSDQVSIPTIINKQKLLK